MWKYYLFVVIAATLVSVQIVFSKVYQRERGENFFSGIAMEIISCAFYIPYYLILAGGEIEFTWFSFWIVVGGAVTSLLCSCFSLKVLSVTTLAAYSIFSMLGGMILPAIYGLTIGEQLSVLQVVAMLLVVVSMFFTVKKEENNKKASFLAILFCMAVFFTSGFSSVLIFMHQKAPVGTVSTAAFLLLGVIARLVLSLGTLGGYFIARKNQVKPLLMGNCDTVQKAWKSWGISVLVLMGFVLFNGTASFLVTQATIYIDAGVLSTISAGSCICLSALLGLLLFKEKLTTRSLISLVLAIAGVVLMVL